MTARWPNQIDALAKTVAAIDRGVRRILVTGPTGCGKGLMIVDLLNQAAGCQWPVALYLNRNMLRDQTSDVLDENGIVHGIRAAGHKPEHELSIQVCSIQTEAARAIRREEWRRRPVHTARLVIPDEAHLFGGDEAQDVFARHREADPEAIFVGYTATPVGLGAYYDELIVAGTNSEMMKCGAIVPVVHYGPEEPDAQLVGYVEVGENVTEKQCRNAMGAVDEAGKPNKRLMRLFGRVIQYWKRLNPYQRPTILFAPGVAESVWFAQEFARAGVAAAHVDGQNVWVDGELVPNDEDIRRQILADHRDGKIKVICNRFVLREGIDLRWAECGLFCTPMGLVPYIQSGGRLKRSCPETGKRQATVIDFAGLWHKHGSLNADREWDLECTAAKLQGAREERLREKVDREPLVCPQCSAILAVHGPIAGMTCPKCKFKFDGWTKVRPVVQIDGTLTQYAGDVYDRRRVSSDPDAAKEWAACYFKAKNAKIRMTFRQAFAMFAKDHYGAFPNPGWRYYPIEYADQFAAVKEVPKERLR